MEQLPERTYFEAHAEELLKQAGLTKAGFAGRMGVARQNVQKVFETKNVFTLMRAAGILNVPLTVLICVVLILSSFLSQIISDMSYRPGPLPHM